jgi:hypothetical protein
MNNCADVRVQKWDSVADSQVAIPAPRFAKIYDRNVILLGSILGIQGKLFIISRNILIVHIRLTIAPGAEIIGEGRGWHASWRQPGFQWVTMVTDSTARWILTVDPDWGITGYLVSAYFSSYSQDSSHASSSQLLWQENRKEFFQEKWRKRAREIYLSVCVLSYYCLPSILSYERSSYGS